MGNCGPLRSCRRNNENQHDDEHEEPKNAELKPSVLPISGDDCISDRIYGPVDHGKGKEGWNDESETCITITVPTHESRTE